MTTRGVRGATTVPANGAQSILGAARGLLEEMVSSNRIQIEDIAAVLFTATRDLDAAFPAGAARGMGWRHVPLMDAGEIPVPGSLPRCIRVLLLWNTSTPQRDVIHVYQGGAECLRPDLARPAQVPKSEEDVE